MNRDNPFASDIESVGPPTARERKNRAFAFSFVFWMAGYVMAQVANLPLKRYFAGNAVKLSELSVNVIESLDGYWPMLACFAGALVMVLSLTLLRVRDIWVYRLFNVLTVFLIAGFWLAMGLMLIKSI